MRSKLFLFVLLIGLCSVTEGQRETRKEGGKERDKDGKEERKCEGDKCEDSNRGCDDENCDGYDNYESDYDNERYRYEPCDYADDVYCVRKFFGKYGQCSVVEHEDRKPVYRKRYVAYLPKVNLTLITTKVRLRQLDGKIDRFYVNKKTNNLILSVDFQNLEINSKLAVFVISRRGREPVVVKDKVNATYTLTLTAVIPLDGGITLKSLKESRVTAFLDSVNQFFIGPRVAESKDPVVAATIAGVLDDVPTAFQEILLTEAPSFFLAYLQKYICDFNIPLSSPIYLQNIVNH